MEPLKIAFFTHQNIISPLEYLRIIGPISYTSNKLLKGTKNNEEVFKYIEQANLVLIQRDFPSDFNFYNKVLEFTRELKKPLVYDFDDNLFILPENHPDRKSFVYSKALMPMLQAAFDADFLTVTNEYLERKLKAINPNIFILPNFLDDQIWQLLPPKDPLVEKPLTIAYMGGDSHKPDLEYVVPVLCEIKEKFSEKINYYFYGVKPPDCVMAFRDTVWEPLKTYQYAEFANDFQKTDADIFIAPLLNNEFNQCKSAIKYLEYSSMGVPGVYSKVFPYEQVIVDGENGFLAASLNEWSEKIQSLISNQDLRYKIAKNAQDTIKDKYLMSKNADLWSKTYSQITKRGITKENQNYAPQHLVRNITKQIIEYYSHCDNKIQEFSDNLINMSQELESKEENIKELQFEVEAQKQNIDLLQNEVELHKQEILFYALSKSWNFTRPFRKLRNLTRSINSEKST